MARYGWDDVSIVVDKSDGGTTQEMKAYIQTINGLDVEAILEDMTVMGSAWEASEYVGLKRGSPIVITGPYDDTATVGPDVVFGVTGITGFPALASSPGVGPRPPPSSHAPEVPQNPAKGALTHYEATLVPTSTITEA